MAQESANLVQINSAGAPQVIDGSGNPVLVTGGKIFVSATDTTAGYIANKIGAGLSISGTNLVIVSTNFIDYGSSKTTGTAVNGYIIKGVAAQVSGTVTITGLPFADTTYAVVALRGHPPSGYASQTLELFSKSASSFTVGDNLGSNLNVSWVAVGV